MSNTVKRNIEQHQIMDAQSPKLQYLFRRLVKIILMWREEHMYKYMSLVIFKNR